MQLIYGNAILQRTYERCSKRWSNFEPKQDIRTTDIDGPEIMVCIGKLFVLFVFGGRSGEYCLKDNVLVCKMTVLWRGERMMQCVTQQQPCRIFSSHAEEVCSVCIT